MDGEALFRQRRVVGVPRVPERYPCRGASRSRIAGQRLARRSLVVIHMSARGSGEGGGAPAAPRPRKPGVAGSLSIEAIKGFVKDYEEAIVAKRGESAKAITEKIAECRKAVTAAKDDDEAELAAKRLRDAIEEKRTLEVGLSAAVIRDMRRHIETPLKPVLAAMLPE